MREIGFKLRQSSSRVMHLTTLSLSKQSKKKKKALLKVEGASIYSEERT